MRIELTSQPLNEAIAKLERIAALYERIGGAQGTVAAGPARGGGTVRGGGGGGSRVVSGRSTVGGRGGGGGGGLVENLMRSNPGLTREQASAMAGSLPGEAARAETAAGPTRESPYERTQRAIRTSSAIQAARSEQRLQQEQTRVGRQAALDFRRGQARQESLKQRTIREADKLVNDEWRAITKERKEQFGGGGGGGARGGIGGGPGRSGMPFFRDRMRIAGTGLVGGIGGPWALAAAAVYGFATLLRSTAESLGQLRRAALTTGGTMQQVGAIAATGGNLAGIEGLRQLRGSDTFAIMEAGFAPDPRLFPGSDKADAAVYQRQRQRLHDLRNRPDYQRFVARRLQMEEELPGVNVDEGAWQAGLRAARTTPTMGQATAAASTQSRFGSALQTTKNFLGQLLDPRAWRMSHGAYRQMIEQERAKEKGPDSLPVAIDKQTQATMELISTMKQTQRDFYGRGMQDRGALPNAIFGADLMKGMRTNRIRLGAFR